MGWEAFRAQPRSQCLRARQWVSASFCDEVVDTMALEEHGPSLKRLLTERRQEVTEIEPVLRLYAQRLDASEPFLCPVERPAK